MSITRTLENKNIKMSAKNITADKLRYYVNVWKDWEGLQGLYLEGEDQVTDIILQEIYYLSDKYLFCVFLSDLQDILDKTKEYDSLCFLQFKYASQHTNNKLSSREYKYRYNLIQDLIDERFGHKL